MAPFGTKGLAFVDPYKRRTFGPHALDVFVVGQAPAHCHLLDFFVQTPKGTLQRGRTNYTSRIAAC